MIDIFESLSDFLGRLDVYLKHSISALMKEAIVKILAHLLSILGLVTKLTKEKRAGKSNSLWSMSAELRRRVIFGSHILQGVDREEQ